MTGKQFATQARKGMYVGIPYDTLDCQALVEKILSDLGVRNAKNNRYNWRGSNHMWREALSWRGTMDDCRREFGEVPLGAWLFTVKNDGGEKARGYNDNDGNAAHIGVYIGDGEAIHSSTGGVKIIPMDARWTHVGLPSMLSYTVNDLTTSDNALTVAREALFSALSAVQAAIATIDDMIGGNP